MRDRCIEVPPLQSAQGRATRRMTEGRRSQADAFLVQEPEQWRWSSYRSYAYDEADMVKINEWPKAATRGSPAA